MPTSMRPRFQLPARAASTLAAMVIVMALALAPGASATQNPFEAEIRAFENADRLRTPPSDPVLFVGSSSFRMWHDLEAAFPGFKVLNRGFGGSQLSDVLHFFDRVVTPYHPALIALYQGDNDLAGGKTVDRVFEDWLAFVTRVEEDLPGTGILFVAVKPSPSRAGVLDAQRELNDRVRTHAADHPHLRFADVFHPMLDDAGQPRPELFLADRLHLNPDGYALWASILAPELETWARDHPAPSIRLPTRSIGLDFGLLDSSPGSPNDRPAPAWNVIGPDLAGTDSGTLPDLVATNGADSGIGFRMVARFAGAEANGTTSASHLPASVTRDALVAATPEGSAFELHGLDPGSEYHLTFYASTLEPAPPRPARYSVVGASSASAELDAAANIDLTATLRGLRPTPDGILRIVVRSIPSDDGHELGALLGALQISWAPVPVPEILFDFGAAGSPTQFGTQDPGRHWNNVTASLGAQDGGVLSPVVSADGAATEVRLQIVSRFNGANENGTGQSGLFPSSATRDSLFGNTAAFSGLANVFPRFRLSGLAPDRPYHLTFYASRLGVSDHRETRYTLTGADTTVTFLNAANNVAESASVSGVRPNPQGVIEVALSPGPANTNPNQFTYLGVLQVTWDPPTPAPGIVLSAPELADGQFHLRLTGSPGRTCRIEYSTNLTDWSGIATLTLPSPDPHPLVFEAQGSRSFFRAIEVDAPTGARLSGGF
ncbi:MAG: hypothetical protein KF833_22040 [Verrucomicrobiae bacterium]|nr:hypothetical protein [Verrucomicrobiae bacterium]